MKEVRDSGSRGCGFESQSDQKSLPNPSFSVRFEGSVSGPPDVTGGKNRSCDAKDGAVVVDAVVAFPSQLFWLQH